jgi:hypothetical protein
MTAHLHGPPEAQEYTSPYPLTRTNVRPAPQAGHFTPGASGWRSPMGGVGIRLPLRRGILAACWTAPLTEGSNMVGWDMDIGRTHATGSALELRARRLETGCWLGLAHHFPFTVGPSGSASILAGCPDSETHTNSVHLRAAIGWDRCVSPQRHRLANALKSSRNKANLSRA